MRFKDIPGLQTTKNLLIRGVENNHVAHAQLFSGKPGGAALSMALAYATYLTCSAPSKEDACGQCSSCSKNKKFIHPDVHFIFPVSATKKILAKDVKSQLFLKEWRDFIAVTPFGNIQDWSEVYGGEGKKALISTKEKTTIINALSLKAFEGKWKIMIIWYPELMHKNAANGILKVLEEPSGKSVFILVSDSPEKLLITLLSRTQRLTIPAFTDQELIRILNELHSIDLESAKKFALLADGSLREALHLSSRTNEPQFNRFKQWMRFCYQQKMGELVDMAEEFSKLQRGEQVVFFQYALSMFRETLVSLATLQEQLFRVGGEERTFVMNFGKTTSVNQLQKMSTLFSEASFHLERNANAKIVFMNLSITISVIIKG